MTNFIKLVIIQFYNFLDNNWEPILTFCKSQIFRYRGRADVPDEDTRLSPHLHWQMCLRFNWQKAAAEALPGQKTEDEGLQVRLLTAGLHWDYRPDVVFGKLFRYYDITTTKETLNDFEIF